MAETPPPHPTPLPPPRETQWEHEDEFRIARGIVFVGRYPFDVPATEVIGLILIIAGERWIIRGVERNAIARPLARGDRVGFLVSPIVRKPRRPDWPVIVIIVLIALVAVGTALWAATG